MTNEWWQSSAVDAFRNASDEFLALIEARDGLSAEDLLHRAHLQLARLYALGVELPTKPASAYEEVDEDAELTHDSAGAEEFVRRWAPLLRTLEAKIGRRWNFYQEVFDPYRDPPEAPVTGSLADDLAGVYLDLLKGRDHWQHGRPAEAVWEWRFGFESHWGEHATGALRAIRTLASTYDLGFPDSVARDA